jgi:hypothetical protein
MMKTEKFELSQFKRCRTVTEDSGFGEDFKSDQFITDKEFTNVIEVIQTC